MPRNSTRDSANFSREDNRAVRRTKKERSPYSVGIH